MPEAWMIGGGVLIGAVVGLGLYFTFSRRDAVLAFTDEREERLTHKLAEQLRCPLDAALDAVRHEIAIAPNQTDETILKRAAYHYRQSLPDSGPCRVYRDRAPG